MKRLKLLVGLANPGPEYKNTRHNVGAWFIESILSEKNSTFKFEKKFQANYSKISVSNLNFSFLKTTFNPLMFCVPFCVPKNNFFHTLRFGWKSWYGLILARRIQKCWLFWPLGCSLQFFIFSEGARGAIAPIMWSFFYSLRFGCKS